MLWSADAEYQSPDQSIVTYPDALCMYLRFVYLFLAEGVIDA